MIYERIFFMNKNEIKKEQGEKSTKSGEFICSTFDWITPDRQKERSEELENIKIKRNKKKNKDK